MTASNLIFKTPGSYDLNFNWLWYFFSGMQHFHKLIFPIFIVNIENWWFIFLRIKDKRPICLQQQVSLLLYLSNQPFNGPSKIFPEHLLFHSILRPVILLFKLKNFDQFSSPLVNLVLCLVLCDLYLTFFLLSYPFPFPFNFSFFLFNKFPLRLKFVNIHSKQ